MSVYFITAREIGMVKIGCAFDPFRRLAILQTDFPLDLKVEALFQGAYDREKELHAQFSAYRVRGEWFRICPQIEALIASAETPRRPRSKAQRNRLWALHHEEPRKRKSARGLSLDETKHAAAMKEMQTAKESA